MTHRKRTPNTNPFERREDPPDMSLANIDAAIFGEISHVDAERQIAEPVKIEEIYPDKTQPRRAVPTAVRDLWDMQPDTVGVLFDHWLRMTNQERALRKRPAFDIGVYLTSRTLESTLSETMIEIIDPATVGPIEGSFLQVVELAAAIRRDGLTNPITVAPLGKRYRLETGERRWLAYHLLYAWFDGSSDDRPNERTRWAKIPARTVKQIDVWRQASENTARQNLNAIGRSRQFAILLMELLKAEGKRFVSFDEAVEPNGSDRGYYAQVANAKIWRVPNGKSEVLLNAMGVSDRSSLSRYRDILSLPDEVWRIGDDYNISEDILYALSHRPAEEAIAEAQQIVEYLTNPAAAKRERELSRQDNQPGTKQFFADISRMVGRAGPGVGKEKLNRAALKKLDALRDWVEEQRERISGYLP